MTKSLDRLTLLETFVRIAERGTISAAARDLGLSQASASRQLSDLEDRLGMELIIRTTHSLSLTKAGETCLREARLLLADWEGFADRFAGEADRIEGDLKIVAPLALGQTAAVDAAIKFQRDNPGVRLEWILEDAPVRFSEVGCDLWIRIGGVPDDTLIVQPLAEVERLIVAAPGFLKTARLRHPRGLNNEPCAALTPFEGGRIPLFHRQGREFSLDARVDFASNNIFAVLKVVLQGNAYAVLPKWLIAGHLSAGELVDVLPTWRAEALTINAAFAPSRRQTRRLRAFLDTMSNELSDDKLGACC